MDNKINISYDTYDILKNFNILDNKKDLWFLMRFICIVIEVHLNIKFELHPPRNTSEMFTYTSDKYWSKIIDTWKQLQSNPKMSKDDIFISIHICCSINYFQYWYHIFKKSNILNNTTYYKKILTDDNTYYLTPVLELKKNENKNISYLIDTDIQIANALFYIKHIKFRKEYCKYIIGYIINPIYITQYLIDKVYDYLSSEYISSRIETENKDDILVLIYDLLDI